MGGEEPVHGPIIRSQYFSEAVPLDCDLHKRLSASLPNLGGTGWLEGAEVVSVRL